jgi:signal transduction histidine kinase
MTPANGTTDQDHNGRVAAMDRRVLIVDDDVDLAESLQDILESREYQVAVAHNIAGAQGIAEALRPNVALLDVNLGRENGLTLITTLKEVLPDIVCVVITARSDVEHAIDAIRRGAFDYLLKPLHPLETLSRLEKCFDKIALQQRAERAEALSHAKSAFLAIVSHELRTPLNAIIGFSQMMESERLGPLGASRYKEYASDIRMSGEHLLQVINNILDLTRAEAGKLVIHDDIVDITEVSGDCVRQMQPHAVAADLTLDSILPASPWMFRGDTAKLRQIFFNLLSNAVKFTPAGGRVELRLEVRADGGIDLVVRDTGVGMAHADIPRALQPFTQLDSGLSRRYEGTGLGLPLTASLVELHGGSLVLDSALGYGTSARVVFPPERTLGGEVDPAPRLAAS